MLPWYADGTDASVQAWSIGGITGAVPTIGTTDTIIAGIAAITAGNLAGEVLRGLFLF